MKKFKITKDEIKALKSIQEKLHGQSVEMGWHNKLRESGTLIALMHSELSEALEGLRRERMDDHLTDRRMVEVELADCIIRIFDAAGLWKLDLAGAIAEKHEYNAKREDHQLVNRMKDGGKKF